MSAAFATVVQSRYPGRCKACGRPYSIGARVARMGAQGWGHEACAASWRGSRTGRFRDARSAQANDRSDDE